MAASSSSRNLGCRIVDEGLPPVQQLPPMEGKTVEDEEWRDWAGLPLDALLTILRRLDIDDILVGPGHVCRPWRRATEEEPDLWRHIDMRRLAKVQAYRDVDLRTAARAAVKRSSGRCEAFWAQRMGVDRDEFFLFLADSAPQLKSVRLISCYSYSNRGLSEGIRKFHMLEELELSLHSETSAHIGFSNLAETCNAAAEACPLLKRLRLNKNRFQRQSPIGDSEAMEIGKMRGLQFLQLFGNSLGNIGLTTILHGCMRLECLDIRHCFNVEMNDEVRVACARLDTLRRPDDSVDDYDLSFGSPEMERELEGPELVDHFGYDLWAPQLKNLRLILCFNCCNRVLSKGIRKFHMLEELELSLHWDFLTSSSFFSLAETCSATAECCPLLKRLRLNKYCFHGWCRIGDTEATEMGKMRGLQFLQLFGSGLGNDGLIAILRGCVRLVCLDIRHCFNVEMNHELRAACDRLHTLRLPDDSVDDYDLSFGSPEMRRWPERPETTTYHYVDDFW